LKSPFIFLFSGQNRKHVPQVFILLATGKSTSSSAVPLPAVIRQAQEMGVKVIVVGVATALGPAPRRRVDNLIASVGSVVSSSDVFTAYDGIQGVENILPMIVDSVCAGKAFVDSGI